MYREGEGHIEIMLESYCMAGLSTFVFIGDTECRRLDV